VSVWRAEPDEEYPHLFGGSGIREAASPTAQGAGKRQFKVPTRPHPHPHPHPHSAVLSVTE
jgi:hypothetical protein